MADRFEYCFLCGELTGRAGKADDSIYSDDGRGPWCLDCYCVAFPDEFEVPDGD